jgi:hypothetical protein
MSSDDDEHPPNQLLQPLSHFQPPQTTVISPAMATQESSTSRKPYQITFSSREDERQYTKKLKENCATFNGDPDQLLSWLRETGAYISQEGLPETDHPFIIRHLLIDDALDYYQAHEDIIFNFYDLRKLFLHKHNSLAHLRTLSSLDSIPTFALNSTPSILTSTQIPAATTNNTSTSNPSAVTTLSFTQTLEDLTQHDIRKTIIEDLHRNYTKFTGDNRQDVIKWLKILDTKFETAGIPDIKKFDLISQLLDKGALDWFQEHKTKFNHSWSDFVDHFKKAFDSPNRARIAMQKLTSYAQSPSQDIRSFCSEMRKLFQEADPQMSSMMKLELLLAKVKPSYRLDLLKQKPKDPDEFETMARDLENTYLVLDAIEQNIQSNQSTTSTTTTTTTSTYPFNAPSPPASVRPSATPYNNDQNQNRYLKPPRYGPRFTPNSNFSQRNTTPNSPYWQNSAPRRPRFPYQPNSGYYVPYNNSQNLFAVSPPVMQPLPQQLTSPSPAHSPMPSDTSNPIQKSQLSPPPPQSLSLVCDKCSMVGHSASDCHF